MFCIFKLSSFVYVVFLNSSSFVYVVVFLNSSSFMSLEPARPCRSRQGSSRMKSPGNSDNEYDPAQGTISDFIYYFCLHLIISIF